MHPKRINEYMPICLIVCLYKILSKILDERLSKVLGKIVLKRQKTFVSNRNILDGVVVVNKV